MEAERAAALAQAEAEAKLKYEQEYEARARAEIERAEKLARAEAEAAKAKAAMELDLVRDAELKAILDPGTSATQKRQIREKRKNREIKRRHDLIQLDILEKLERRKDSPAPEGGGFETAPMTSASSNIECMGWEVFQDRDDPPEETPAIEVMLVDENEHGAQERLDFASLKAAFSGSDGFLPNRIRIRSIGARRLLRAVLGSSMGLHANIPLEEPIVLMCPFKVLIRHEQRIRSILDDSMDETHTVLSHPIQADEDKYAGADSLRTFIDDCLLPRINYLASPLCSEVFFSDLWYLYKPGDLVIGQGGRQAYRVLSVASTGHRRADPWPNYFDMSRTASDTRETPIHILCVHLDFDGKQFGPISTEFIIKKYDGRKPVESFEIYPANFDRHPRLRQNLIERGQTFIAAASIQHMHYSGLTLDAGDEVDSQVVVDFAEAFDSPGCQHWKPEIEQLVGASALVPSVELCEGPGVCCKDDFVFFDDYIEQVRNEQYMSSLIPPAWTHSKLPSAVIYSRTLEDSKTTENRFTDDEIILMSYRVFGFVLRSRKWAKLDLNCLRPIGTRKNSNTTDEEERPTQHADQETSFDQLVLPRGHKDMVLSLITQHFRDKDLGRSGDDQVDIVRGKGKGLIMLLHGAPGVGKTSTAECVAELFHKPLFQITCGDLGTTAKEVESSLEHNFTLANKWDCILLLDEADVFLARRSSSDFIRNGLVAVFLRVLEYYAGILFLTTNRVGDFDEAFASRIHISLHYPPLDELSTRAVFQLNFKRIKKRFQDTGRRLNLDEVDLCVYATDYWRNNPKSRWNGRQIRNACQTALALSEFEAQGGRHDALVDPDAMVNLGVKHFKTVSEAYLNFIKYIDDIYGTDGDTRAKENFLRAKEKDEAAAQLRLMNPLLAPRNRLTRPSPPPPPPPPPPQAVYHYPGSPPPAQAGYYPQQPYQTHVQGQQFPHHGQVIAAQQQQQQSQQFPHPSQVPTPQSHQPFPPSMPNQGQPNSQGSFPPQPGQVGFAQAPSQNPNLGQNASTTNMQQSHLPSVTASGHGPSANVTTTSSGVAGGVAGGGVAPSPGSVPWGGYHAGGQSGV
ncbi:hypothetical protein QBC44DRAFT_314084 [Cladorrhinum sp. PSN332]|nr:hypothetical protein QBC44DRAFT_314084 [Cladorrhinum sp. PSN332]